MDFSDFPTKLYESLSISSDTPWYYPTALVVIVIGIMLCLFEILNQFCSYLQEKSHRSEKPKLFNIPDKKNLSELTGEKNNAQKLMDKIYLPKSKEQILEIMEKVGGNKMFVKGGKGAISGELCTKEDIDENSKSQSTESDHNISGGKELKINGKAGANKVIIKEKTEQNKDQFKEQGKVGVKKVNKEKAEKNKKTIKEKAKMSKEKTDKNVDQFKVQVKGIVKEENNGKAEENRKIIKEKSKMTKEKTKKEKAKGSVNDKNNGKDGDKKEVIKEKTKMSKEKTEKEKKKDVVKDKKNGKVEENNQIIKEKVKVSKEKTEKDKVKGAVKDKKNGKVEENKEIIKEKSNMSKEKTGKEKAEVNKNTKESKDGFKAKVTKKMSKTK